MGDAAEEVGAVFDDGVDEPQAEAPAVAPVEAPAPEPEAKTEPEPVAEAPKEKDLAQAEAIDMDKMVKFASAIDGPDVATSNFQQ